MVLLRNLGEGRHLIRHKNEYIQSGPQHTLTQIQVMVKTRTVPTVLRKD